MRLRKTANGVTLNVVAGSSAILFSIDMTEEDAATLLGFHINKKNLTKNTGYDVSSIKHFPGTPPSKDGKYNTRLHPWQSFLWEDFYVADGSQYQYKFVPVFGKPGALSYGKGVTIKIEVPKRACGEHEVYFNRGVAGSQAYASEFKNMRPDQMAPARRKKALQWLSKGLEEAMIGFIKNAKDSTWQLRCCFYEFIYPDVLKALKAAADKGADVKIIYDSRHEAVKNDAAIKTAGLKNTMMIRRAADPDYLQHNKYMILLKNSIPVAIWTGSTNITEKAIFGHCNVGHIIRNKELAGKYLAHWEGLRKDPLNADARKNSLAIQPDLTELANNGMTVFFSPRPGSKVLSLYSKLISDSKQLVCGMFPFSFSKLIKTSITADTEHLKYIILDKKTKNTTLVTNDYDNVIVYAGVYEDALYGWANEVDSGEIFYNGVNFIHNKVILVDPLGDDPVVISGSANFSDNSINRNDENTLVVKGNKDLADMYFTEFARVFNHYSTRQDTKKLKGQNAATGYNPAELRTNPADWTTSFYKPTALKCKRRKMFSEMQAKVVK